MRPLQPASGASSGARRWRLGVLVLLCVGCAIALGLSARRAGESTLRGDGVSWRPAAVVSGQAGPAAGVSTTPGRFGIAGAVGGLYPGASAQLVLTVTNPLHFAIVVTSISTTVGSPSAGCVASNLTVAAFSGQLTVAAGGSAQVSVPVALSHAAPDACQAAVFPLQYSGVAGMA